jgi:hypothetical protein
MVPPSREQVSNTSVFISRPLLLKENGTNEKYPGTEAELESGSLNCHSLLPVRGEVLLEFEIS